eukprot:jgi/Chlat1/8824/Chrsp91S08160
MSDGEVARLAVPGGAGVPKPLVLCGPSGVGKGTLINKLMAEYPNNFGFSVSHTTRAPRGGEHDGVHYHFTTADEFRAGVGRGDFLEHAEVHGNYYGTSLAAVEDVRRRNRVCVLDIDVQGASQVRKSSLDAVFVFVAPPSREQLEERLRGRGTETEEAIQKRLRNAAQELERSTEPGLFDYVLVNDDLERTYAQLKILLRVPEVFAGAALIEQLGPAAAVVYA